MSERSIAGTLPVAEVASAVGRHDAAAIAARGAETIDPLKLVYAAGLLPLRIGGRHGGTYTASPWPAAWLLMPRKLLMGHTNADSAVLARQATILANRLEKARLAVGLPVVWTPATALEHIAAVTR